MTRSPKTKQSSILGLLFSGDIANYKTPTTKKPPQGWFAACSSKLKLFTSDTNMAVEADLDMMVTGFDYFILITQEGKIEGRDTSTHSP